MALKNNPVKDFIKEIDIPNIALSLAKNYILGYKDGVTDTQEEYKKAISDGLRHGSPECGRALQKFRKHKDK